MGLNSPELEYGFWSKVSMTWRGEKTRIGLACEHCGFQRRGLPARRADAEQPGSQRRRPQRGGDIVGA
jgi:hypothetical protein